MAVVTTLGMGGGSNGTVLTTALQEMLMANDDIQPGADPSYNLCRQIYLYHPLGAKLVERPLEIAQSQKREIKVPDAPEDRVKEAFEQEWNRLNCDLHIFNTMRLARVYGIASVALLIEGEDTSQPIDFTTIHQKKLSFNVYDPLNTAGSLVLSQDPLAMDFQHTTEIRVRGSYFHRNRTCVILNESPIYIEWTGSAYGFVGRSVYQRSLYPLKSFLQTLVTDDMVARKCGVLVAKIKHAGSVVDNLMIKMFGLKRSVVKEAENTNVISIGNEDDIQSINLTNLEGPLEIVRNNILMNIASAAGMPSKLITEETFAEGFGEGTEDAKAVARYIDRVREQMQPLYDYFDKIVRYRAWNPSFFAAIQADFPEYQGLTYQQAFYRWANSFTVKWPSLLTEPDSEMVKVDEVKLRAIMAFVQLIGDQVDPDNKIRLIEWAVDNMNSMKFLFEQPLELDFEGMQTHLAEQERQQQEMQEAMKANGGMMPGQQGEGGKPPGQGQQGKPPGQQGGGGGFGGGGAKKLGASPMGGMKLGGMGASKDSTEAAITDFREAVARMLETKAKAKGKQSGGLPSHR